MNEFSAVISMPLYFFSPNSNIVFRNQMESWVLFLIQLVPEICFFLFTWPLRWSWEVNLHHISFVWFKVLKFLGWCFQDAPWDPFKYQLWKDFLETDIVSNTNDWIVADIILSLITQETTLRLFRERQWWSLVKIKLWL